MVKIKRVFVISTLPLFLLFSIFFPVNAQSPSQLNLFSINSEETNEILYGCPVTSVGGIIGNTITALGTIIGAEDYASRVCENITNGKSSMQKQKVDGLFQYAWRLQTEILEQRPASGVEFINQNIYALLNFSPVTAQQNRDPSPYYPGSGYVLLQPIQEFWGWSVNVVFGFIILFIIIVSIGIILRDKVPGLDSLKLESSIPKIALALILVPFSYSICGAAIDFLTLSSNVVHGFLLGPGSPGRVVYDNRNNNFNVEECIRERGNIDLCDRGLYIDDQKLSLLGFWLRVDFRPSLYEVSKSLGADSNVVFTFISGLLNRLGLGGGDWVVDYNEYESTASASAWLGTILNILLVFTLIYFAIVEIMIKTLFPKYLALVLSPIFSPFVFATIALPGNGINNTVKFIKGLIAASLGFTVSYAVMLLLIIFTSPAFTSSLPNLSSNFFAIPLFPQLQEQSRPDISYSGRGFGAFLFTVIGLVLYFQLPKIVKWFDKQLDAAEPMQILNTLNDTRKLMLSSAAGTFATFNPGEKGLLGSAVRKGISFAQSAVNLPTSLQNAVTTPIKKWYDNFRGIKSTSDTRSAFYQESKDLNDRYNRALQDYQNTSNPFEMRRLSNEMKRLEEEAKAKGISISATQKKDDRSSVKLVFQPNSNFINSSDNALRINCNNYPANGSQAGRLLLSLANISFTGDVRLILRVLNPDLGQQNNFDINTGFRRILTGAFGNTVSNPPQQRTPLQEFHPNNRPPQNNSPGIYKFLDVPSNINNIFNVYFYISLNITTNEFRFDNDGEISIPVNFFVSNSSSNSDLRSFLRNPPNAQGLHLTNNYFALGSADLRFSIIVVRSRSRFNAGNIGSVNLNTEKDIIYTNNLNLSVNLVI